MIRIDDILEKVSGSYSEKDINVLKKAYVFSGQAHQGQVRRSGEPYLSHPLEVTNMLADMKLDKTTLAAGLLHDVLEDTSVKAIDLQKAFGKEVSLLVEGVTKLSRVQASSPQTRHAESIRKIIIAMTDDMRVIFIKLADRIHNLKTLRFLPENKQRQIAKETLDIYAPIANRLGMGRIKAELEELSFRYVDPENYFKVVSMVEPQKRAAEMELKKIRKAIDRQMKANNIPADVFFRIKRLYSIYNKLQKQKIEFDQVYDFMALRLITDSVKNCYTALGIIHQKWPHLPNRFRDFIAMPKHNLYQALHTTIITEKKQMFEIQIRTQDMHRIAEDGIAAHWKYKETDPQSIMKEDKRLRWLREMVDLYKEQENPKEFLKNLKTDLIPEEVFVFTPNGKVISLPLGASALDFAFHVHTEIGLHSSGARINGKLMPLKTMLKTGDIVEVATNADSIPSRQWLNMTLTSRARHHIQRWLNLQDRKKHISVGKKLWGKQLEKSSLSLTKSKETSLINRIAILTNARINKTDDFFALVGSGKLALGKREIEKILSPKDAAPHSDALLKKKKTRVSKKIPPVIKVGMTKDALTHLAKCCAPIKGESIIGYMTLGKGISVHALRCSLVKTERLDPTRQVEVSWDVATKESGYKGKLLIVGDDAPGVLAQVTAKIADLGGNITKADVSISSNRKGRIRLTLDIRDIKHFKEIIKKVSQIKEISSVDRI